MNRTLTLRTTLLTLVILALTLITAAAQEIPAPLLTLISPDPAHPVQFQLIAPGDVPLTAGFSSRLELDDPREESTWNVVYIAVANTGWSEGVVGLISGVLDSEGKYVALEVDADSNPIEGGLAFDLVYDETLDAEGGFTLHVLISRTRRFGIFPAGVEDGQSFPAMASIREMDGAISRVPAGLSLEAAPEAIFAPLILEFHIVARPIPTAVPQVNEAAESSGGWGACGSCDSCGHAGECVLSPEGECVWNPSTCGASPVIPAINAACVPTGEKVCTTRVLTPEECPPPFTGTFTVCYDSCGNIGPIGGECGGDGDY